MHDSERTERFRRTLLPHLAAAYNLARWLARNDADAEDLVQEAYLRALNFFDSFRGGDGRAWLLAIVRNTYYTWARSKGAGTASVPFDENIHAVERPSSNPEAALLEKADRALVRAALEQLPDEFREALVLREMEGLSYQQIAAVAGVPMGTVMSRLARARQKLGQILAGRSRGKGAS
jgi:RNA polymerase sigma-70 factor (ECF subfamily)